MTREKPTGCRVDCEPRFSVLDRQNGNRYENKTANYKLVNSIVLENKTRATYFILEFIQTLYKNSPMNFSTYIS